MFDSVVVDVVISLALIFFVFSMVTSGARELIAKALETRAKEMWKSLRGLLDDPVTTGLRELRLLAAAAEPPLRPELSRAVDQAEATLRAHIEQGETAERWKQSVTAALEPVRAVEAEHAAGNVELKKAIASTTRRMVLWHSTGKRTWQGLLRASRRGGDRPTIPQVPTLATAAELAAQVRSRALTLTDAVSQHSLVRQIDRTWPGFQSKMQWLQPETFSAAVVDIVRAGGVEPALKAVFADPGRAINALPLTDEQKQQLWQPIAKGFTTISDLLQSAKASAEDIDNAFSSILGLVDSQLGDGESGIGLDEEQRDVLMSHLDAARRAVTLLNDDPIGLLRAGAAILDDSSPIKEVVQRLTTGAGQVAAAARAEAIVLRDSLENWYDTRMDAMSAWYKKRSRYVAFGLGLLVVVAFNVDGIKLPQELWHDKSVREVIVAVADQSSLGLDGCVSGDATTAGMETSECVADRVDSLVESGIPIGWDVGTLCDGECDTIFERATYAIGVGGEGRWAAVWKVLGWLLAAAALSLGASFWYDVLKRATGFKKTVKETREKLA